MRLFSSERPLTPNSLPRLCLEGSVVPTISIIPDPTTKNFRLVAFLRNFSDTRNRSYSYHFVNISAEDISAFFIDYLLDPEATLEKYFGWSDQRDTPPAVAPLSFASYL